MKRLSFRCRLAVIAVAAAPPIALVLFSSANAGDDGARVAIEQVLNAWKSRQDRSVRIEWKETEFIPARSRHAIDSDGRHTAAREPAADTTVEELDGVSLDGKMMRYFRKGMEWREREHAPAAADYLATFDGALAASLFAKVPVLGSGVAPQGFIEKDARHPDYDTINLRPVLLMYRGCDPQGGGIDLTECVVSAKAGLITGRTCVIIAPKTASDSALTIWVDPARDFLPLRAVYSEPGREDKWDISFRQDASLGWIPTAWKFLAVGLPGGNVFHQSTAEVTKLEINPAIPRSEFQIDFPVGSVVKDLRTEDYETSIVRPGGARRRITDEEVARRATYQEILATESGMAGLARPRSGRAAKGTKTGQND